MMLDPLSLKLTTNAGDIYVVSTQSSELYVGQKIMAKKFEIH